MKTVSIPVFLILKNIKVFFAFLNTNSHQPKYTLYTDHDDDDEATSNASITATPAIAAKNWRCLFCPIRSLSFAAAAAGPSSFSSSFVVVVVRPNDGE